MERDFYLENNGLTFTMPVKDAIVITYYIGFIE
jgi:hypothetical protein